MITNPDESRKAARLVNSEWADSLGVKIFDLRRDLANATSLQPVLDKWGVSDSVKGADFDESKHPRDERGRFSSGGSGPFYSDLSATLRQQEKDHALRMQEEDRIYREQQELNQRDSANQNDGRNWKNGIYDDPTVSGNKTLSDIESHDYWSIKNELTPLEQKGVRWYAKGGMGINDFLRNNGTIKGVVPEVKDEKIYKKAITAMTQALDKASLPENVTVYRAGIGFDRLRTGQEFVDNGFVSTSFSRQFPMEFPAIVGAPSRTVAEIRVPKGSKTLAIPQAPTVESTVARKVHEVVLQRGAKFKVVRGGMYPVLEYLGSEPKSIESVISGKVAKKFKGSADELQRFEWTMDDIEILSPTTIKAVRLYF